MLFLDSQSHINIIQMVAYFSFLYFRYASLYFCCAIEDQDNELLALEVVHRYVELLDRYFGNVSVVKYLPDTCQMFIVASAPRYEER